MTLPDRDLATGWIGKNVVDPSGASIGRCTALFADDATGASEWLGVSVGDANRTAYVLLIDAREDGDDVRVSFSKDAVLDSPSVSDSGHISEDEEATLYAHYGVAYSRSASESGLPATETVEEPVPVAAEAEAAVAAAPAVVTGPTFSDVPAVTPSDTVPPVADTAPVSAPTDPIDAPAPIVSTGGSSAAMYGVPRRGNRPPTALLAGLAGLAALVAAIFGLRQLRRHQPPPLTTKERLSLQARAKAAAASDTWAAQSGQLASWAAPRLQAGTEAAHRGARVGTERAQGAAAVAGPAIANTARTAARVAADRARMASGVAAATAKQGAAATDAATAAAARLREQGAAATDTAAAAAAKLGQQAAAQAAAVAASATSALRQGASSVQGVTTAVRSVPETVADATESIQETSKTIVNGIMAALALGVGYIFGARAGRQRYEQLKSAAITVQQRPEVQQAKNRIAAVASARLETASSRPGVQRARDMGSRYYRPNRPTMEPPLDPADLPIIEEI